MRLIIVFSLFFSMNAFSLENKTILFLGDSLTEGYGIDKSDAYPSLVEQMLKDKNVKVLNGGVSGSTTASGLSRFNWFLKVKPDYLFIVLGANDGLRGIELSESKSNLKSLIKKAQDNDIKVILGGMLLPPNYGKEYTSKFKSMFEGLRDEFSLLYLPFLLEGVAGQSHMNLDDGIHPNKKGHEKVAQTVVKFLKEAL